MSYSVFLSLANAVAGLISQAPAILPAAAVRVGSRRPTALPLNAEVVIRLVQASGRQAFVGDTRTDWDVAITLDIFARVTPGAETYAELDALLAAIYARLLNAQPQAGSAMLISSPALSWDVDEADQTLALATLGLRIECRSESGGLGPVT